MKRYAFTACLFGVLCKIRSEKIQNTANVLINRKKLNILEKVCLVLKWSYEEYRRSVMTCSEHITRILSEFVYQLAYEQLPNEVVEKTKEYIIDYYAAAFAGMRVNRTFNCAVQEVMEEMGGKEECDFLLSDKKAFQDTQFLSKRAKAFCKIAILCSNCLNGDIRFGIAGLLCLSLSSRQ